MAGFHAQTSEAIAKVFETDIRTGLSADEAAARLERYGPNELPTEKKKSVILLFFAQFHSRLTYILFGAAGISLLAGEEKDAIGILIAVLIDVIFGFVQERRAEDALEKLKQMVISETSVIRDAQVHRVPSAHLVPGDIIILEPGDRVAADARVCASKTLRAAEAALTGESSPVSKDTEAVADDVSRADMASMVWMGTSIVAGQGRAIVVSTGEETAFGSIATSLTEITQERAPLEHRVDMLGQKLGIFSIVLAVLVFLLGYFRGTPLGEMFFFAVAMVVSVIPEGLPAVLALVLAIGVHRMARRNAIIRHVPSVETLGVADIICTDKTGTLTENKMTVRRVFTGDHDYRVTGEGWEPKGEFTLEDKVVRPTEIGDLNLLLRISALCNRTTLVRKDGVADIIGEPTEGALVVMAAKGGMDKNDLQREYQIIDELPFNSERKFRALLVENEDMHGNRARQIFTVGAFEVLGERSGSSFVEQQKCELTDDIRQRYMAAAETMANDALRIVAVAVKDVPDDMHALAEKDVGGLTLLGLVAMMDPPRAEVRDAIADCRSAGVRVIMITGDHKTTAVAVGREIGLVDESFSGDMVLTDGEVREMTDDELAVHLVNATVFARVTPETKLRIVELLQSKGHTVAMTGDGVNDAPALKRASIGVAMGIAGTDVTKEVADMVLTDDNFVSIVNAIEEGRVIFRNVKQTVAFLFMTNVGEVVTVLATMLMGLPLPLLPAQILWMNLVTDGFPDVALATEKGSHDVLNEPPRPKDSPILTRNIYLLTAVTSTVMCIGTVYLFMRSLPHGLPYAQTMAFTTMAVFQLWNVFNLRSIKKSLFSLGLFTNMYVFWGVVASLLLQLAVIYLPFLSKVFRTVPLSLMDWVWIISVSSSVFVVVELYKLAERRGLIPAKWMSS